MGWAELQGEYSPAYYAHRGSDVRSQAVHTAITEIVDSSASICELGCSAGRHLAHLHAKGFTDLWGVDLNTDAFDVLAETYPALDEDGTFYEGALSNVLPTFDDDQFDAVYSVETLQHVHPAVASTVFGHISRITEHVLVTAEVESRPTEDEPAWASTSPEESPPIDFVSEDVPLYYRNWNHIFTDRGFRQTAVTETNRDVVRTFVPDEK